MIQITLNDVTYSITESSNGTSRITTFKMYPMSLYESKESNGSISLKDMH